MGRFEQRDVLAGLEAACQAFDPFKLSPVEPRQGPPVQGPPVRRDDMLAALETARRAGYFNTAPFISVAAYALLGEPLGSRSKLVINWEFERGSAQSYRFTDVEELP